MQPTCGETTLRLEHCPCHVFATWGPAQALPGRALTIVELQALGLRDGPAAGGSGSWAVSGAAAATRATSAAARRLQLIRATRTPIQALEHEQGRARQQRGHTGGVLQRAHMMMASIFERKRGTGEASVRRSTT